MTKLTNPVPLFLNARGALIDAGYIYIGTAGMDPEANPITIYADAAFTVTLPQPLRTQGGVIVHDGSPTFVFFNANDASLRIRDAEGVIVNNIASITETEPEFQPLDSDLTAISMLSTTEYGRSLLTAASASALRSMAGITPFSGGTVTSNITRASAGTHWYWADPAMASGKVTATEAGAASPLVNPGDVWIELAPA